MAFTRREKSPASVPGIALARLFFSLQRPSKFRLARVRGRQKQGGPAPFHAWLLSLILIIQPCTLPIPLAFLLINPEAKAMTKGCDEKTCCTALCYVDKHGVHHCVHKHHDSCGCDSLKNADLGPMLHNTPGTLPDIALLLPVLLPNGWISPIPDNTAGYKPETPSPPPK